MFGTYREAIKILNAMILGYLQKPMETNRKLACVYALREAREALITEEYNAMEHYLENCPSDEINPVCREGE